LAIDAEGKTKPTATKMIDTPYGRTFVRICGPENANADKAPTLGIYINEFAWPPCSKKWTVELTRVSGQQSDRLHVLEFV